MFELRQAYPRNHESGTVLLVCGIRRVRFHPVSPHRNARTPSAGSVEAKSLDAIDRRRKDLGWFALRTRGMGSTPYYFARRGAEQHVATRATSSSLCHLRGTHPGSFEEETSHLHRLFHRTTLHQGHPMRELLHRSQQEVPPLSHTLVGVGVSSEWQTLTNISNSSLAPFLECQSKIS